ncbi:hypothetical protein [Sphingomonas sp.]|uniref:hypothetical protein n=1 Tax=Sphingomonas sp. TaxID=28214 RepID=UPI0035C79DBA
MAEALQRPQAGVDAAPILAGALAQPAAAEVLPARQQASSITGNLPSSAIDYAGLSTPVDLSNARSRKPSFFESGGWGEKIGNILFAAATGAPAPGVRRRLQEQIEQRRMMDAVRQRQAEREEWMWREQWKRDNPDDQFTQYMRAAGIDPASPQGRALYRQRAESIATPPMMAVDGFDPQGNPTKTFMPRTAFGAGGRPQGAGPAVGTVRNGYRFNGGNPNDRTSWVPVGGASSPGGATFR